MKLNIIIRRFSKRFGIPSGHRNHIIVDIRRVIAAIPIFSFGKRSAFQLGNLCHRKMIDFVIDGPRSGSAAFACYLACMAREIHLYTIVAARSFKARGLWWCTRPVFDIAFLVVRELTSAKGLVSEIDPRCTGVLFQRFHRAIGGAFIITTLES